MKWKTFLVASAVAAASLASATSAAAAAIISISPSPTNVAVGGSFSLDVILTGGVNVGAYQLSVGFDPSALSATAVTDGTFLDNFDSTVDPGGFVTYITGVPDNVAGTVTFIAALLNNTSQGVSGDGLLARIQFTALSLGTTVVTPSFNAANLDYLADWNFNTIETGFAGGTVNVTGTTPVPEPTSMLMLAIGLGAALGRRRHLARLLTHR